SQLAAAQSEFSLEVKKSAKILLEEIRGRVTIKNHDQAKLIVQASGYSRPEKSKGLMAISGNGVDNTMIGLEKSEIDGQIKFTSTTRKGGDYTFFVPKGIALKLHNSTYYSKTIEVYGFDSELEIKATYGKVYLEDVTGPVILDATYGAVNGHFVKINQEQPSSIISAYGEIDITLPANTAADLNLESSYGDIYTDFDVKMESRDGDMEKISMKEIRGNINGGGVELSLRSPYKNIYLRKGQ
ncbi:MAG: DUF4097 family beta strand repeat-containing protein, partial [Bacteroidota bacterium]